MKKLLYIILAWHSCDLYSSLSSIRSQLARIGQSAKNFLHIPTKTISPSRNFIRYVKTPEGHYKAEMVGDKELCKLRFYFKEDPISGQVTPYKTPSIALKPFDWVSGYKKIPLDPSLILQKNNPLNNFRSFYDKNNLYECIPNVEPEYFEAKKYIQNIMGKYGIFSDVSLEPEQGPYLFQEKDSEAYAIPQGAVFNKNFYKQIKTIIQNKKNNTSNFVLECDVLYTIYHELGHLLLGHTYSDKRNNINNTLHEIEADNFVFENSIEGTMGAIILNIKNYYNKKNFLKNNELQTIIPNFLEKLDTNFSQTQKDAYYATIGKQQPHPSYQESLESAIRALYNNVKDPQKLAEYKELIKNEARKVDYPMHELEKLMP